MVITVERIKQALIAEEKLDRLEALGVDNWEGYGFNDDEFEETLEEFKDKLENEEIVFTKE